jgi:D-alanine-D-alanine ligase
MKKINVGILFGGKSGEHEVSMVSAMSVAKALDKSKYSVQMIGIDKTGRWVKPSDTTISEYQNNPRAMNLGKEKTVFHLDPSAKSDFDVILPVLHGTFGEDGTIQGLLELANVPYVGSGVLGSALGMDKDASKRLFKMAGIPVVPWLTVRKHEFKINQNQIIQQAEKEFGYPYFVKPANMGSSVGVHKIKSKAEAAEKLQDAFLYDTKVLIEKAVAARELEVSVLGNHEPKASIVGEIIPTHEFYSYEAKYLDENGAHLNIPAVNVSSAQVDQIKNYAIQAFLALECRGLGRVDFFLDKNTGELFLNEINTIPGFTSISMYPKLWAASGLPYSELLDQLIKYALELHAEKNALKTSFEV